jgi:hypothetical protein
MFGIYFYHQRIRKAVASFGKIFNDIYVIRKNSSGGGMSTLKVPLSYGPKAKYLDRLREAPNLATDTKVAMKLPRMSFEITGISYDAQRQLPKVNNFNQAGNSVNDRTKVYSAVPYQVNFALSIYSKTQDDGLQVVEQIIPFFNPQYNLTIKPLDGFDNIKEDVPVVLNGVSLEDNYEGDLAQRAYINYNLDFTMHIFFYGALNTGKIVRETNMKYFNMQAGLQDSDLPLQRTTTTLTPSNVSADSDFGFNEVTVLSGDSDASAT